MSRFVGGFHKLPRERLDSLENRGLVGDIKAVEGVYLQALNPRCLIVVTENAQ